mgnify:CR=1 FL=1
MICVGALFYPLALADRAKPFQSDDSNGDRNGDGDAKNEDDVDNYNIN